MLKWFRREDSSPAPEIEAEAEKIRQAVQPTRNTWFSRVGLLFNRPQISEELWDELEEALVSADVGLGTSERLIAAVRDNVMQIPGATPETARGLLKQEMVSLLSAVETSGTANEPPEKPWVVLVVGVNGSGKTTTIAKMAGDLIHRGNRVLLGAADTFRAAASEQLITWGERVGAEVVAHQSGSDPGAVAFDALQAARSRGADVVFIDTCLL
jgi:fused signal recognition particle receptor